MGALDTLANAVINPAQAKEVPAPPSSTLAPGDSQVTDDYLAGRAMAQRGNPAQELDALIGRTKPTVPNAPPASETPAAIGAAEGAAAAAQQRPLPFAVPMPGATENMLPIGLKIIRSIPSIAKDVALGAIDTPRQVLGGVLDYGNNLMRFADDVVKKAEESGMPNLYVRLLDKDGGWSPAVQSEEEFRKAQAEGRDDVFQVPTTGKSEEVTGEIIRAGTTFMMGRTPVTSGAGAGAGLGTQLFADFASGATGTNPNQPRLSNLIDQVAPNFVTDWLKAKPGEEEPMLGRLKTGLEYSGLGAIFAGTKAALKWMKGPAKPGIDISQLGEGSPGGAGRGSPGSGPTVAGQVSEAAGGASTRAADAIPLGDPLAPAYTLPEVTPRIERQAVAYLRGEGGTNPVGINLSRIGSGQDIEDIIRRVSTFIPKNGPVGHDATQSAADALGLKVEDFLAGRAGSALSREELLAARMALDSAAKEFGAYAKIALDPATSSEENWAKAIKAFSVTRAMQQYVEGAKGEAGRTLEALKIMSQSKDAYSQAIRGLLEQGSGDIRELFQKAVDLQDPTKIGALIGQSARLPGRDPLLYAFYNTLLSYKTVTKKAVSDVGMAMWNIATRYTAENYGASGEIQAGEAGQLAYGYIGSLKDGFRAAGKALKAGESQFHADYQSMDALRPARISALANGAPDIAPMTQPSANGWAYLRSAMPTTWIGAVDDMAKVMNYRAELRALAYRTGTAAGKTGEDLADHIAGIMDNPGFAEHQQALTSTLRTTFQEPLTGLAEKISTMRDSLNIPIAHTNLEIPVGRILLPFVKIPANIMSAAYRNSPMPLVFQSKAFQSEIMQGGATRDLAMAKIWLGSAVTLTAADLAILGYVTGRGPSDPGLNRAWQEAGNQPYSVQIPGVRPISYRQGAEPFGMMVGTVADTINSMKFAKDPDRENAAVHLMFGAGQAALSASYLMGMSDFLEAQQHPDENADRYAKRLVASLATPNVVAQAAHAIDPWMRAHYGYLDAIEARLPFVSRNLPYSRNLWGDPIPVKDAYLPPLSGNTWQTMISPFALGKRPEDVEPIDKWIWENREAFPHGDQQKLGIHKIGEYQNFASPGNPRIAAQAHLEPEELDRFQELAGNGLKEPQTGLGAKDYLNALVLGRNPDSTTQRQWDTSSSGVKALMVQSAIQKYRSAAKTQLLGESSRLRDVVTSGWQSSSDRLSAAP